MGKKIIPMSTDMEFAVTSFSSESVQTIMNLVEQGESINARQRSTGSTLLILAIQANLLNLVHFLVEKGCDVDAKNAEGETALMYAARAGNNEIVKMLLENGANPNCRSRSGFTAMQWAVLGSGNEKIVEIIRQSGGRFS